METGMAKYRKKIVAGNWKMNKTASEASSLTENIMIDLSDVGDVDVVLCPPYTALGVVGPLIDKTRIGLGAQNMHWELSGAYTGEISSSMLRDLYCQYVILGHSERRSYFSETDDEVNKKARAALETRLTPIICVGETLEERDSGRAREIVKGQLQGSLAGLREDLKKVIIAYEPVWAIGTGRTATPEQAQEMHAYIRSVLAEMAGEDTADTVRIQYGGSVKPNNAAELFAQPDIDGGLIGGAALEARHFIEIVQAAIAAQ